MTMMTLLTDIGTWNTYLSSRCTFPGLGIARMQGKIHVEVSHSRKWEASTAHIMGHRTAELAIPLSTFIRRISTLYCCIHARASVQNTSMAKQAHSLDICHLNAFLGNNIHGTKKIIGPHRLTEGSLSRVINPGHRDILQVYSHRRQTKLSANVWGVMKIEWHRWV